MARHRLLNPRNQLGNLCGRNYLEINSWNPPLHLSDISRPCASPIAAFHYDNRRGGIRK